MATVPELLETLKKGVAGVISSAEYRAWLSTVSKFHRYSLGNTILILWQKHGATYVAGFVRWKELGRFVKKGEKGIAILAPCFPRKEEKEKAEEEDELIREPIYYRVVNVFDISQTEGKPLPEFQVPILSSEPPYSLWNRFHRYRESLNLGFARQDIPEMGHLDISGRTVVLKSDIPEGQAVKTLAHELAHHVAGTRFGYAQGEILAESIAFVVCGHFGFDTGVRSFPYVAFWAKDFEVLKKNLLAIKQVASDMIEKLERL